MVVSRGYKASQENRQIMHKPGFTAMRLSTNHLRILHAVITFSFGVCLRSCMLEQSHAPKTKPEQYQLHHTEFLISSGFSLCVGDLLIKDEISVDVANWLQKISVVVNR